MTGRGKPADRTGSRDALVISAGWPNLSWSFMTLPAAFSGSWPGNSASHLKRSLASLAKRNIIELTTLVKTRLRRMRYRPGLLAGFPASTRLDLAPFCNPRQ
jgi:hypothetical protein